MDGNVARPPQSATPQPLIVVIGLGAARLER
jgi:hypothetical protein